MFQTIASEIPVDPDYPARARQLDLYRRVLEGTFYDVLPHAFHEERDAGGNGEYVPLRKRRPSVRYPLARIVVDDSLALLFGEGHFPTVETADRALRQSIAAMIRDTGLDAIMAEAALRGSIGSAAVTMAVIEGQLIFAAMDTLYLTPSWDRRGRLVKVTELRKVAGADLTAQGYALEDPKQTHWFCREWTTDDETWFQPWAASDERPARIVDVERSAAHGLGFVPVVWIKNLPGGTGDDGACTFRLAIETSIEIDYQLSQAGRGLKYSSDPLLVVREPAAGEGGDIVRSSANALITAADGDAKLLEIGGTAAAAVIEYVRTLREFALEGVHGNRSSPEKLTGAQSGRALEMMNQGLIWLADNLRVSYGRALLDLIGMVRRASVKVLVEIEGIPVEMDASAPITLRWPRWYDSTSDERAMDAQALVALQGASLIARETAVKSIADEYGIDDVAAEVALIEADRATAQQEAIDTATAVQPPSPAKGAD